MSKDELSDVMIDVNDLVEAVDRAHGAGWSVWRTAMGGWCLQVKPHHNLSGATLGEVLRLAAEWRDLPAVLRKPQQLHLAFFSVVKDGSKWALNYDGRYFCGHINTKTKAMECAKGFCDRSSAAVAEWDSLYGKTIESGTEGVDFRYAG